MSQAGWTVGLVVGALLLGGCCCRKACPRVVSAAPDAAPVETAAAPKAGKAETNTVLDALRAKRVKGLDWQEIRLDQAASFVRTISGRDVVLSPAVREQHLDDIRITAQLDDVSLKTLLDVVMTDPYELVWEVRGEDIHICTPPERVRGASMRLRYYDVKDLVKTAGSPAGDGGEALAARIAREIAPTVWTETIASIEARNGILIVRAPPVLLQRVDTFLSERRFERMDR